MAHFREESLMDLRKMSGKQLSALIAKAQKRQSQLARKRLTTVRAKVMAVLKAEDVSVSELFGAGTGTGRRGPGRPPKAAKAAKAGRKGRKVRRGYKVKPKYRNPADPSQTWAGRGLKPKWFRAALAGGRKEKDLLIKG
jgi:DNA-binding protein H-NS